MTNRYRIVNNDHKGEHSRHNKLHAARREFRRMSYVWETWDGKRQKVATTFPLNHHIVCPDGSITDAYTGDFEVS